MIRLRQDCLVFKNTDGSGVPASAHEFAVEIIGEAVGLLDEEVVKNAAHAVLHYFKEELHRTERDNRRVYGRIGRDAAQARLQYRLRAAKKEGAANHYFQSPGHRGSDRSRLRAAVFSRLRDRVRSGLGKSPVMLRFRGLRDCVKHLARARKDGTHAARR